MVSSDAHVTAHNAGSPADLVSSSTCQSWLDHADAVVLRNSAAAATSQKKVSLLPSASTSRSDEKKTFRDYRFDDVDSAIPKVDTTQWLTANSLPRYDAKTLALASLRTLLHNLDSAMKSVCDARSSSMRNKISFLLVFHDRFLINGRKLELLFRKFVLNICKASLQKIHEDSRARMININAQLAILPGNPHTKVIRDAQVKHLKWHEKECIADVYRYDRQISAYARRLWKQHCLFVQNRLQSVEAKGMKLIEDNQGNPIFIKSEGMQLILDKKVKPHLQKNKRWRLAYDLMEVKLALRLRLNEIKKSLEQKLRQMQEHVNHPACIIDGRRAYSTSGNPIPRDIAFARAAAADSSGGKNICAVSQSVASGSNASASRGGSDNRGETANGKNSGSDQDTDQNNSTTSGGGDDPGSSGRGSSSFFSGSSNSARSSAVRSPNALLPAHIPGYRPSSKKIDTKKVKTFPWTSKVTEDEVFVPSQFQFVRAKNAVTSSEQKQLPEEADKNGVKTLVTFERRAIPFSQLIAGPPVCVSGVVTVRAPSKPPSKPYTQSVHIAMLIEAPEGLSAKEAKVYASWITECKDKFMQQEEEDDRSKLVEKKINLIIFGESVNLFGQGVNALREHFRSDAVDFDCSTAQSLGAALSDASHLFRSAWRHKPSLPTVFNLALFTTDTVKPGGEGTPFSTVMDSFRASVPKSTTLNPAWFIVKKRLNKKAKRSVQQFDVLEAIHKLKARVHTVEAPDRLPTSFALFLAQDVFDIALENVVVDVDVGGLLTKNQLFLPGTLEVAVEVESSLEQIATPAMKRCRPNGDPIPTYSFKVGRLAYGAKRDISFNLMLSLKQNKDATDRVPSMNFAAVNPLALCCAPPRPATDPENITICTPACASGSGSAEKVDDDLDMCKICLEENQPRQFSCTRLGSNCNFAMCADCSTEETLSQLPKTQDGQDKCVNCNLPANIYKRCKFEPGDACELMAPVAESRTSMLPKGSLGVISPDQEGVPQLDAFSCKIWRVTFEVRREIGAEPERKNNSFWGKIRFGKGSKSTSSTTPINTNDSTETSNTLPEEQLREEIRRIDVDIPETLLTPSKSSPFLRQDDVVLVLHDLPGVSKGTRAVVKSIILSSDNLFRSSADSCELWVESETASAKSSASNAPMSASRSDFSIVTAPVTSVYRAEPHERSWLGRYFNVPVRVSYELVSEQNSGVKNSDATTNVVRRIVVRQQMTAGRLQIVREQLVGECNLINRLFVKANQLRYEFLQLAAIPVLSASICIRLQSRLEGIWYAAGEMLTGPDQYHLLYGSKDYPRITSQLLSICVGVLHLLARCRVSRKVWSSLHDYERVYTATHVHVLDQQLVMDYTDFQVLLDPIMLLELFQAHDAQRAS